MDGRRRDRLRVNSARRHATMQRDGIARLVLLGIGPHRTRAIRARCRPCLRAEYPLAGVDFAADDRAWRRPAVRLSTGRVDLGLVRAPRWPPARRRPADRRRARHRHPLRARHRAADAAHRADHRWRRGRDGHRGPALQSHRAVGLPAAVHGLYRAGGPRFFPLFRAWRSDPDPDAGRDRGLLLDLGRDAATRACVRVIAHIMTLHFAYGSNMSRTLMHARCPQAKALGVATLPGWRFVITPDGVGSIAPRPGALLYGV